MLPAQGRLRFLRLWLLATVGSALLLGCGEAPRPEASAEISVSEFDRTAYAAEISGDEVAVSARLASPTNDGDGDVRVEVDRRPADATLRLAVSIIRGSGQVAFEVMEVGGQTYFRDGPLDADGEWISTDRSAAGTNAPRIESLLAAFPLVGDIVGLVRAEGWTTHGAEPCPAAGDCFVLTSPAYEFASLFIDASTYRPVHIRLARPGMRAAGEIEIDWAASGPVEPPVNARQVDAGEFQAALAPVLQALGL